MSCDFEPRPTTPALRLDVTRGSIEPGAHRLDLDLDQIELASIAATILLPNSSARSMMRQYGGWLL